MAYGDKVIDHFNNPRNVGSLDKDDPNVGTGIVGAPECGDVMKLQIQVDEHDRIVDAKFKTFGCGSAIASSSLATEWIKGRTLDEALEIKNTEIVRGTGPAAGEDPLQRAGRGRDPGGDRRSQEEGLREYADAGTDRADDRMHGAVNGPLLELRDGKLVSTENRAECS